MTLPSISENEYYKGFIRTRSSVASSLNLSLPFYHSCRGEVFRKIVSCGKLDALSCKEFNEHLLYLFYGRPAYRIAGNKTSRDLGRFPVCFVLNRRAVTGVVRIFPFDSGAFLNSVLEEYCGKFSTHSEALSILGGYDLGTNLDDLAKFISLMYGGDDRYLATSPSLKDEELKGMCFELSRILDMARSNSEKLWDNRALTSEIQISNAVDLDGSSIDAVILPTQFISNDTELQNYFYDQNIEIIDYNVSRMKPESATDLIEKLADEFRLGRVVL